jgi:hypothetical protein
LEPSVKAAAAFVVADLAPAGLAAVAFGSAARNADFDRPAGFNGFDGAVCDVPEGVLAGLLVALRSAFRAGVGRVFEGGFFAAVFDRARVAFPVDSLGDFLRVFLDIRLPFVAFGGSIMGYCGSCPVEP